MTRFNPKLAGRVIGFAVMPGKAVHWFSCSGKDACLMVVTFDKKYDIVWVDVNSRS